MVFKEILTLDFQNSVISELNDRFNLSCLEARITYIQYGICTARGWWSGRSMGGNIRPLLFRKVTRLYFGINP